jgi:hypothetical protein
MSKYFTIVKAILIFFMTTGFLSFLMVVLSPLFDKTHKGGFFNERDNPKYIILSLATAIIGLSTYYVVGRRSKLIKSA